MWSRLNASDQALIRAELDGDLQELVSNDPALALQVQQARWLRSLHRDLAGLSREVWLLKEGRSA